MQEYRADLHIHSRFSRATSSKLNIPLLAAWARVKGLSVLGTGDFTHPKWRGELAEGLRLDEKSGLYAQRDPQALHAALPDLNLPGLAGLPDPAAQEDASGLPVAQPLFMLQGEISSIYKRGGKVRKVHNLVFMPTLEAAERFCLRLGQVGNLHADGRPILGLDSRNLLEMVLETDPQAFLVPAHIWTPWFSLFGSKSGFDRMEECFGDLAAEIFALETGLSSDPAMNRLWSHLDRYRLVSNSDAHSGENLGREANVFAGELSYAGILRALKEPSSSTEEDQGRATRFLGTLEFFPEEGKYHMDGHRKCNVLFTPEETRAHGGLCPVCGGPLTVGVLNRVVELADRSEPVYGGEKNFASLVPLPEVLGEILGVGAKSRKVGDMYAKAITRFGSELAILQHVSEADLGRFFPPLGEAVARMRRGEVRISGGFDGEYGVVRMFSDKEQRDILRGANIGKSPDGKGRVQGLTLMGDLVPAEPPKRGKEAAPQTALPLMAVGFPPDEAAAVEPSGEPSLDSASPGGEASFRATEVFPPPQGAQAAPGSSISSTATLSFSFRKAASSVETAAGGADTAAAAKAVDAVPQTGSAAEAATNASSVEAVPEEVATAVNAGLGPTSGSEDASGDFALSDFPVDPEASASEDGPAQVSGGLPPAPQETVAPSGASPAPAEAFLRALRKPGASSAAQAVPAAAAMPSPSPAAAPKAASGGKAGKPAAAEALSAPDATDAAPVAVSPGLTAAASASATAASPEAVEAEPGDAPPPNPGQGLNPSQERAVMAGPPPVLVLAGPGTGKTRTLVARVMRLLDEGVAARRILAVTFTRRAAAEMDERLRAALGEDAPLPRTDTLHALGLELWHRTHADVPVLLSEESARRVFAEANSEEPAQAIREGWQAINLARERMEQAPPEFAEMGKRFLLQKQAWNLADYTDLLEFWLEQIRSKLYPAQYDHVLVDEVQDLSRLQLMLVCSLISSSGQGFFGIGDPDQSIYSFRGAHGQCRKFLEGYWPNLDVVSLTHNYRSRPGVLAAARGIIGAHAVSPSLTPVRRERAALFLFDAPGADREAGWVAERIAALIGMSSHTLTDAARNAKTPSPARGKTGRAENAPAAAPDSSSGGKTDYEVQGDGYSPGDIAILVRTHALAPLFRKALDRVGVPVAEPAADSFWSDPRVTLILRAAGRILGIADTDTEAEKLTSFCPDKVFAKGPLGVAAFMSSIPPFDALFWQSPAFRSLVKAYDANGGWAPLLTWIGLQNELELVRGKAETVQILSLHAAKGLEFGVVFLPCLEDGLLPFVGPELLTGKPEKGRSTDMDEERRLLYVGVTRARDALFLSHSAKRMLYGRELRLKPSRFLDGLPQDALTRSTIVAHSSRKEKQLSLL